MQYHCHISQNVSLCGFDFKKQTKIFSPFTHSRRLVWKSVHLQTHLTSTVTHIVKTFKRAFHSLTRSWESRGETGELRELCWSCVSCYRCRAILAFRVGLSRSRHHHGNWLLIICSAAGGEKYVYLPFQTYRVRVRVRVRHKQRLRCKDFLLSDCKYGTDEGWVCLGGVDGNDIPGAAACPSSFTVTVAASFPSSLRRRMSGGEMCALVWYRRPWQCWHGDC